MKRIATVMATVLLLMRPFAAEAAGNNCMDCLQKQTQMTRADGSIWFTSDAVCCMTPCWGFPGYELMNEDVGYGCLTKEVNNELVVGDICASNDHDKGCPGSQPQTYVGTPIIIDTGSNGYRLTSAAEGVRFDLRNDGAPAVISWTRAGADNAFLARDRNGNGRIDNGSELFGNFTVLRSGQLAKHGFEALSELDSNLDGAITVADQEWPSLLLWTDRDHDGVSIASELQPLSVSAITELGTTATIVGRRDAWGNQFRYMAHLRLNEVAAADARRAFYDIILVAEP